MGIRLLSSGQYALLEDEHRHRFLVLNARRWYVWIEGQKSAIIVHTGSHGPSHVNLRTLRRGRFYLVDFRDDPNFRDMPHLFLQESADRYREFLLPNGLPDETDPQKRFVVTRRYIAKPVLEGYLAGTASLRRPSARRRARRERSPGAR